jgi:hypothetical protein
MKSEKYYLKSADGEFSRRAVGRRNTWKLPWTLTTRVTRSTVMTWAPVFEPLPQKVTLHIAPRIVALHQPVTERHRIQEANGCQYQNESDDSHDGRGVVRQGQSCTSKIDGCTWVGSP